MSLFLVIEYITPPNISRYQNETLIGPPPLGGEQQIAANARGSGQARWKGFQVSWILEVCGIMAFLFMFIAVGSLF